LSATVASSYFSVLKKGGLLLGEGKEELSLTRSKKSAKEGPEG